MKPIAIVYATREGHTCRIAHFAECVLRRLGRTVDVFEAGPEPRIELSGYAGVIVAASVHAGRHERELIRFVRDHRRALSQIPTAFLSVTLSAAGAQRKDATAAEHEEFAAAVDEMLDTFFKETGWTPTYTKAVAGALLYSKYNFLVRRIMRRIARKAGGGTDTSMDYIYTDWGDLSAFVEEFEGYCSGEAPRLDLAG